MKYPFKKAALKNGGGDLSARWHVEYYIWSEQRQKLVRRRRYENFEKFNTYEERMKYGLQAVKDINSLLPESCIEPLAVEEDPKPKKDFKRATGLTIVEHLLKSLSDLYPEDGSSYPNYKSTITNLTDWLDLTRRYSITFERFNKPTAQEYVDFMHMKQGHSGVTIRNKISHLKALSNKLLEREEIDKNPFLGLSLPKSVKTNKNAAFSHDQIKIIKNWCELNAPFDWIIYSFIYYSYMRPVEIRRLKVSDLDFENNKIHVRAAIAKNNQSVSIEMPEPLKDIMLSYIEDGSVIDDFVFASGNCPGQKPISKNVLGSRFLNMRKLLRFEDKFTLYSWKHTGVVFAYKNGVDIKAIQQQCRHSSIEQTDTYLKSLGFAKNEEFLNGIPSI